MSPDEERFAELSARAERGELQPIPGTALYGKDAEEAGQQDLMRAAQTDTLDEALRVLKAGRPRRGEREFPGESPVVRVRIPAQDYAELQSLATSSGRSPSDLVREGVRRVLAGARQVALD
jgi:hypothetical protein